MPSTRTIASVWWIASLCLIAVASGPLACCASKAAAVTLKLRRVSAHEVSPRVLERLAGRPHRATEWNRMLIAGDNASHTTTTPHTATPRGSRSIATAQQYSGPSSTRVPLLGSVLVTGYYAIDVRLGTPPRDFQVIVDTGSTMGYVPCAFCGDRCGTHTNPPFDPNGSSTAQYVPCRGATCATFCGSHGCGCQRSPDSGAGLLAPFLPRARVCTYSRRYQEASSSAGVLLRDAVRVGSLRQDPFTFGCETEETGAIFRQRADGVLGLGDGPSSLMNQLHGGGTIANAFAFCIGREGGGTLVLGAEGDAMDVPPAPVASQRGGPTPAPATASLLRHPDHPEFYTIGLRGMRIGGSLVNVSPTTYSMGYGAVLDTGTTFAYFPDPAYRAFVQQMIAQLDLAQNGGEGALVQVPALDPRYPDDQCFALGEGRGGEAVAAAVGPASVSRDAEYAELLSQFPSLSLEVEAPGGGTQSLALPPINYMFKADREDGRAGVCLGVYNNGDQGTLLGAIVFRDYLATFHLDQSRVVFEPADCAAMEA